MNEQELRQAAHAKRVEAEGILDGVKRQERIDNMTDDEIATVESLQNEANALEARASKVSRYDGLRSSLDADSRQYAERNNEIRNMPHTDRSNTRNGRHQYSIARSMLHLLQHGCVGGLNGLEGETQQETVVRCEHLRGSQGLLIPWSMPDSISRADTTTVTGVGALAKTVSPDVIQKVRDILPLVALGAKLEHFSGPMSYARTNGATVGWKGEAVCAPGTALDYDSVDLRPKRLTGHLPITGEFLREAIGSVSVEASIWDDLSKATASKLFATAVTGSGVAEVPQGVLSDPDVPTITFGSGNGGAATHAKLLAMEASVLDGNPNGEIAWTTNSKLRSVLKTIPKLVGAAYSAPLLDDEDRLLGHRLFAASSQTIPSNLVAGSSGATLSALVLGDWSECVIGVFGATEFLVDPLSRAECGITRFIMNTYADIAIKRPGVFAKAVDVSTA